MTGKSDEAVGKKEQMVSEKLRRDVRRVLNGEKKGVEKEDRLARCLRTDLEQIGRFYRTEDSSPFLFRHSNRRLYEVGGRPESDFAQLVTYLADVSVKTPLVSRCLDRLRAHVVEEAEIVQVHALAYNSPDVEVIAVNDFAGGMWSRKRGGQWEWKPNGQEGILFWTPPNFVETWQPEFSTDPVIQDEEHLEWFLEQPHFADDVLTARDQRMLLRALLLSFFFPSLNRTRPIQAHLGQSQQRQHDTGKTMAGKLIGMLLVGQKFEPTPVDSSPGRGEEALQLALMHQPFVLLDNVDSDIKWLNDFLCTYATGARPTKRKLYTDTMQVHVEYRGRLAITSRRAKFNRADTASRTIPFRFKPIAPTERKTEPELLDPVIARRGQIWAGLLSVIARVQDALSNLSPPSPSLRLADFEQFGWCVAAVYEQEREWESAMVRLRAAQVGFALEDERLFPILQAMLKDGDLPEQKTSEFHMRMQETAGQLGLDLDFPVSASACTQRLNELKDLLESRLDIKVGMRTLNGYTLIRITRGPTWGQEVTEVTGHSPSLQETGGKV